MKQESKFFFLTCLAFVFTHAPGCIEVISHGDCGNGTVEQGETCDPPSSCPIGCDDGNDCTEDTMIGTAQNCNVDCSHQPITQCTSGDGCCPAGCTEALDQDCSQCIQALPTSLDFGSVKLGCASLKKQVRFQNFCDALVVINIWLTDPSEDSFIVADMPVLPIIFPQGTEFSLYVTFQPNTLGSHANTLQVQFENNAAPDLLVPLSGTGGDNPAQTDVFLLPPAPPKDVLWVVDNSNEDDHSNEVFAFYVNFFKQIKSNPTDVRLGAIVGDCPAGCVSTVFADCGSDYLAVVDQVGGISLSFCSPDWGQMMSILGEDVSAPERKFGLSQPPDTASIVVKVGVSVVPPASVVNGPDGWTYLEAENAIWFGDDVIPPNGSRVEVSYRAICQ